MRSIQARYALMQKRYLENYSTYICFARAIKHQHFNYKGVSKWFGKLVEKEDYCPNDRKAITDYLYKLSCTS